jgi:hypothetical protein
MTRDTQPAQHGALWWTGTTLLVLWNVGMLLLLIASRHTYLDCRASDDVICFNLTGPILFVLVAVDAVVALIATLVHRLRVRRARPPG